MYLLLTLGEWLHRTKLEHKFLICIFCLLISLSTPHCISLSNTRCLSKQNAALLSTSGVLGSAWVVLLPRAKRLWHDGEGVDFLCCSFSNAIDASSSLVMFALEAVDFCRLVNELKDSVRVFLICCINFGLITGFNLFSWQNLLTRSSMLSLEWTLMRLLRLSSMSTVTSRRTLLSLALASEPHCFLLEVSAVLPIP